MSDPTPDQEPDLDPTHELPSGDSPFPESHPLELLRKLDSTTEELGVAIQETKNRADKDPLTGLDKRDTFERKLALEIGNITPEDAEDHRQTDLRSITFLMLDVDNFKEINDTYGHQAGDEALKKIAKYIRIKVARRARDILCRYGGDEIVVALIGDTEEKAYRDLGFDKEKNPIPRIEIPMKIGDQEMKITVSGGLYEFGKLTKADMQDPDRLETLQKDAMSYADRALYLAKESGRNQIRRFGDLPPDHRLRQPPPPPPEDAG